jgi:hypothetical protein
MLEVLVHTGMGRIALCTRVLGPLLIKTYEGGRDRHLGSNDFVLTSKMGYSGGKIVAVSIAKEILGES